MVNDRLAGTAFVVKHGMIVTNAHVLRAVADYDAKKKLWRVKPGASVTFDRERELGVDANCPTALPDKTYALNGVIYAAPDASTDVKNENIRDDLAVILSSTDDKFPSQLTVSTRAAEKYASKMVLAIIGYPGPPEQMSIGERMQYFSAPDTITPVFPYKRLAEGYCGDRAANADGIFAHLVNTAGGNSGSPIIDLADGSIVGIHVRGEDSDFVSAKNYGISGERIIAVLARAGVLP